MTVEGGGTQRYEDDGKLDAALRAADEGLGEEDQRVLRVWRESLALQDPRYESKALLKLAATAMADEEFRDRLVNETEAVLEELDVPEGTTLRFFDNTEDTLNVVLPPKGGQMKARPVPLREVLSSRTSSESFLRDDFDLRGDLRDIFTGQDGDGTPPRD